MVGKARFVVGKSFRLSLLFVGKAPFIARGTYEPPGVRLRVGLIKQAEKACQTSITFSNLDPFRSTKMFFCHWNFISLVC